MSEKSYYNGEDGEFFAGRTFRPARYGDERGREGLALLFEISKLLSGPEHIESVLKSVLDRLAAYLGIIRGMITIVNRSSREIAIAEAWGLDGSQKNRGRYSPGEGVTGKVIETGNPVAIKRIADEPLFLNRTGARKNADAGDISFVCVPIRAGAEIIGAIGVDLPHTPESLDYEVRVLSIVAASISQVVRLHQAMHEEMEDLKAENSRLEARLRTMMRLHGKEAGRVIGNSKAMQNLYQQVEQVCGTEATVLLLGESGVGKERVAGAIHYASPRSGRAFIKVNCAAIPESLIESSLFGHEKGAFTGAVSRHKGYFEQADGGTIFLDEIGELPLSVQSKFLRVLQEREFERVGGNDTVRVDIRVIAATNSDLHRRIGGGTFREDLYYRLSVFPLTIPPLRERKTDIMPLAGYFIEQFSARYHKHIHDISPAAADLMTEYSWPGNVRELQNCLERAVILCTGGTIHSYHLPPSLQKKGPAGMGGIDIAAGRGDTRRTLKETLESVERELIARELSRTGGNISRSAASLGISERIMGLRAAKYGLKPERKNR
ncbi:MAG: sigma 54-interacting transcriptional regulator [Treponema sp.]|jgi:Nif-specific regulatory protein|nr:sigma 54-interacting transcriptional regulator [Treponema sp.]